MQSPDILHIMRCATSPAYTSCPTLPVSPGSQYSLNLHKHLLMIKDLLAPVNGHNRFGIRDNLSQSVPTVSFPSFLFFSPDFLVIVPDTSMCDFRASRSTSEGPPEKLLRCLQAMRPPCSAPEHAPEPIQEESGYKEHVCRRRHRLYPLKSRTTKFSVSDSPNSPL